MPVRGLISTRLLSIIQRVGQFRDNHAAVWVVTLLLLGALAVALGLTFGESANPSGWVKVWGGPTEGPTPLNLRIERVEADPTRRIARVADARIRIEAGPDQTVELPLVFDDQDTAYVTLTRPVENPTLTIFAGESRLATGRIQLDRARHWQQRRVRDGWFHGKSNGTLTIAVGCREGVFALDHAGDLGISIADAEGQPVATKLTLELEGLEPTSIAAPMTLFSDAQGHATVQVVPKDLSASVRVIAGPTDTPIARYFSSIPVATGSIVGGVREGTLFVDSLIPIARVYYALVNERGRWAAGALDMTCDAATHCRGERSLGVQPTLPAWLMVGREPALDGPNVIGWPIATPEEVFVPQAVVIRDQLLLDGKPTAMVDAANQRASRFRRALFGIGVALLVLVHALARPLARSQREASQLARQLPAGSSGSVIEKRPISTALLILLVMLGLGALAAWIKARILGG